jgi:hypothetical protein
MLFSTTGTDLVYNIVEEQLTGLIDGVSIDAYAGSGGRAGTKTKGAVNIFLANNPYATGVKKQGQRPGGPLPLARYTLKTHETKSVWIRLLPFAEDERLLGNRAGFAIHGRGTWGSDGCIVPDDFHVVQKLHALTKAREKAGKPAPTLAVVAIGDFERFDRLRTTA